MRNPKLKEIYKVDNVVYMNDKSRLYHVALAAANRPLKLVTCPELLGADTVMTEEAYKIIKQAAKGLKLKTKVQDLTAHDATILCDMPMTSEDILALVFPEDVKAI